uniref:Pv-fam-b protein n=1 Tax=Meloidogyne floridensis TaxID=298350 RepID=A0A915NUU9_9BILA
MRLWRLLIYFTLLNAYFICVETLKVDGKFEKLKIDKVKPKELKLEAETKRMTFRFEPNEDLKQSTNPDENLNKTFKKIKSLCAQVKIDKNPMKGKGKRKGKGFKIPKKLKIPKLNFMSKVLKVIPNEYKVKLEKCCGKIDDNPQSLENCRSIFNEGIDKIEKDKTFLKYSEEGKNKKKLTEKEKVLMKGIGIYKKLKIYYNNKDTKSPGNVRTKRGAVTKYVLIPLLATAGIVSIVIGLSILFPLIVTPGFIIGFAGAAFFGGIAWLCLITIRNLANKEKNVSFEKEGHYYHSKDNKGNLVKHEVKRTVKHRRSYSSSRRRSNTYKEIRNSKKVKTRRVKTYRKRSETIVEVIEGEDD